MEERIGAHNGKKGGLDGREKRSDEWEFCCVLSCPTPDIPGLIFGPLADPSDIQEV